VDLPASERTDRRACPGPEAGRSTRASIEISKNRIFPPLSDDGPPGCSGGARCTIRSPRQVRLVELLVEARRKAGITQTDLAARLGLLSKYRKTEYFRRCRTTVHRVAAEGRDAVQFPGWPAMTIWPVSETAQMPDFVSGSDDVVPTTDQSFVHLGDVGKWTATRASIEISKNRIFPPLSDDGPPGCSGGARCSPRNWTASRPSAATRWTVVRQRRKYSVFRYFDRGSRRRVITSATPTSSLCEAVHFPTSPRWTKL
jgi:hypothetical protein